MPKVLISDKLSPAAVEIFRRRGIEVDLKPGLSPAELRAIIAPYDGLAVRSATKVTRELLDAATNLKVVGRAGIGVDNVDIRSATARGVVVMNTPHGNTITTAEHAIAMMFALARQIPEASRFDQGRQVGEEPLHGRGADRQDARPDRLRQYRLHRRRPRHRAEDAGARLRPVPQREARARARRREGGARRAAGARRHHHAAHAADRCDAQHPLARGAGEDRSAACASSTARAAGWWTKLALAEAIEVGPRRRRGARRVRDRARHRSRRCSRWRTSSARRISAPRRPRRRRTSRCRSPSR